MSTAEETEQAVLEQRIPIDAAEAQRFLALMVEDEPVTFQTFDDDPERKASRLANIFIGSLDAESAITLETINKGGAGIFWTVNVTDGDGRTARNITAVRALFLDLDGAPLQPVLEAGVEPHAVVETSPGKWHIYWKVHDCPLDQFTPAQQALARKFQGDLSVNDLPRVMRLPGFLHCKGQPFKSRIKILAPFQAYEFNDLVTRLGLTLRPAPTIIDPATGEILGAPEQRHAELVGHVLAGDVYHSSLRDLASSLVATNMHQGAVVNHLKALMDVSQAPKDDRWRDRKKQIPELVRTAALKFTPQGQVTLGQTPAPDWLDALQNWSPTPDLRSHKGEVKFAVDGWIQAAKVGALVAAGGTGKTTLLLILAISIATGRPFYGCAVTPGTFVLLSGDDPLEDLQSALVKVCEAMVLTPAEWEKVAAKVRLVSLQGLGGTKTFSMSQQGSPTATELEHKVLAALSGIDDLVGIAFDTLRQFCGGQTNDEQVIKLTISAMTHIAVETGAFVIVPHHTGKQNYRDKTDDMYAGSGSAAIADNSRFVLLLQSASWSDIAAKVHRTGHEDGDPLVLTSTRGSLLVRAPEPIYLCRNGFSITHVAGAVLSKAQVLDQKDRAILQAIRGGAQTKNAIGELVKGKRDGRNKLIDDLVERGLIDEGGSQSGSPKLMVSAKGGRFLDARDAP